MGKSSYIQHSELNDIISKREGVLRERIENDREATLALESLLLNLEKKRKLTEVEMHKQWGDYCKKMQDWRLEHFQPKPESDDMSRAMSEPNKPNYLTANND